MSNRRVSDRVDFIMTRSGAAGIYGYSDATQIALNEAADALDNIADMVPIGGVRASDALLAEWARETILPTLVDIGYASGDLTETQ